MPWHEELILHPHATPPFPNNSLKEDSEIWHVIRVDKPYHNYSVVRTSFPLNCNLHFLPPLQSFSTAFESIATGVFGSFSGNPLLRWTPVCLPEGTLILVCLRYKILSQLPWQQKAASSRCIQWAENPHDRDVTHGTQERTKIIHFFNLLLEHIWA